MNRSALVNAAGADFVLMGEEHTQIKSTKPVIAVCAVRTGCGKSQVSREIFKILRKKGIRVASIRHPMPYDTDLNMQTVQKFVTYEDLNRFRTTIEEREEYEPYIDMGGTIFSGVDYEKILREAEKEADVIIWDGGNNDFSFYKPDLLITIADPHRAGHEVSYYAGELNFRSADVIIINKINTADRQNIELVRNNATELNPDATVIMGVSSVSAEGKEKIKGKRVLVIEDGPTVTHGGMPYGAGTVAAEDAGVKEIIDPRPFAVGSIKETFEKYTHLTNVLPAMGYGKKQISELEKTINNADAEYVVSGTPIDITRVLSSSKPILHVKYGVGEETVAELEKIVEDFVKKYI
jgi:predicted GTPase